MINAYIPYKCLHSIENMALMFQVPNENTLNFAQINSNQIIFKKTSNVYEVQRKINSKMTLVVNDI